MGRLLDSLKRDLFVLEDENDPRGEVYGVWPPTILDQVFDQLDPTQKNLRQIIEDLRQEIITGGRGNIVFPVTSVNGKTEDVEITAADIGLGRVDNTRDIDKPLSVPQKNAVMEILAAYDFNVNFDEFYKHLMDTSNPHDVSLDQINKDGVLEKFIQSYITKHNYSTNDMTHVDIRRNIMKLWSFVEYTNSNIEERLEKVLSSLDTHYFDKGAHQELFDKKENINNKVGSFSKLSNNNETKYPSTKAVVEFVFSSLQDFKGTLPNIENWIDDITVVEDRSLLPSASEKFHRKAYFIRRGNNSYSEVAVCRKNPASNTYSWDIKNMGVYSKFDPRYFVDSTDGMTIRMGNVIDDIISENGMLDTSLSNILKAYYTKREIDDFNFVKKIKIMSGTMDGTIRYYINDDLTTMSEDVKIPGLNRLAYLEYVTEEEIFDNAVHSRHIMSRSIQHRHLTNKIVYPNNMTCTYGYLLGNTLYPNDNTCHEIKLMELADALRPLIGGWPDPNTPGGNPWSDMLKDYIMHPHVWKPGEEQYLNDYSYAMRFQGEISCIPNMSRKIVLSEKIKIGEYQIIDAGGTWMYQSNIKAWTILGGSNITGHTYGVVNMDKDGLYFETISTGDRMNAPYDIWVKYVKTEELDNVLNPKTAEE